MVKYVENGRLFQFHPVRLKRWNPICFAAVATNFNSTRYD